MPKKIYLALSKDNLLEIKNNVFGDMLTENPDVARSAFGSHRVITDRWKGMNQQQLEDIRSTQAHQVNNQNQRLKISLSNLEISSKF